MLASRAMRSRRIRLFVKLGISSGLLILVLSIVPISEVFGALLQTHLPLLACAVPLVLAGPFLSASRLKILTRAQGMGSPLPQLVQINFAVCWYGLFLPGHLAGGAIRWYLLSRLENRSAEALAAVVLSRLNYLAVLAALGVLFLVLDVSADYGPAMLLGLLPLLLIAGIPAVASWPLWRRLSHRAGDGFVGRLLAAVSQYQSLSHRQAAAVSAISALENMVGVIVVLLLAAAVSVEVPFLTLGWMRSAVQLLDNLPLTIAGLGIREASLLVLLEPYGVAGERAVALAFILLGRRLLLGLVGGLLEGIRLLAPRAVGRYGAPQSQAIPGNAVPSQSGKLGTPSA